MLAFAYIAGTLAFFTLMYLWLDESLLPYHSPIPEDDRRSTWGAVDQLGSPPPLPERKRPTAYGRRKTDRVAS